MTSLLKKSQEPGATPGIDSASSHSLGAVSVILKYFEGSSL